MNTKKNNITLIGMPGSGKSTVGIVLAKILGFSFLDSDLLIQNSEKKLLWQIMQEYGTAGFNRIEERVNREIIADHTVIATGGSVIYGPSAMKHLREISTVIYLDISYPSLAERLGDLNKRGVVLDPGETLLALYNRRIPLYKQYAHLTVNVDQKTITEAATAICEAYDLSEY